MITNYQHDAYMGFLFGGTVMVYLHNSFVSVFLYKTRPSTVSNINKIIINISGAILFIIRIALSFTPVWVDLTSCKVIYSLSYISSFFFRTGLAFFLLWRLRQIGKHQIDKWASIILFSARTIFQLIAFCFIKIELFPTPLRNWCSVDVDRLMKYEIISIGTDFLIDLYVTFRLIQILRSANNNLNNLANANASMRGNTKRTLFTGVMYWNFVRLGVASMLNLSVIVGLVTNNITLDQLAARIFFSIFFYILMSYVVTVDAEIVKVIKGENKNKKGSDKSKHMENSSPTNATHKSAAGSASLPKLNTPNSNNNIQTYDVSFKRLSFFEWANKIMDFQHEKNCIQESNQEFEEIIEGPLEDTDHDLEKDEVTIDTNRSSNISEGSTTIIPDSDTIDI